MNGKMSKVRAEIERLIEQTKPYLGACAGQVVAEANNKIAAYNEVLGILDSMQEEPKSKFEQSIQEGDNIVYNEDLDCRVNLSQLDRVAKKEEPSSSVWHEPIELPDSNKIVLIIVRLGYIGEPGIPYLAKYDNVSNQYISKDRTDVCNRPILYSAESVEKWIYVEDILNLAHSEATKINVQEEPINIWHDASEETPTSGSNILMVRKEEKDTNFPPIAGCFHGTNSRLDGRNWGYYNGFCYNEIEPPVKWAYIDDLLNLTKKEEPVSEDLEKAASRYANEEYNYKIPATLPDRCRGCYAPLMYAFKAGANWRNEQIIKRLCNHANINQMVEKFEDKYKPEKVLDTEYYKRGIFDTFKAIKES